MANKRRGILGNLARLASLSQSYRPSVRGISILGDEIDTLERITNSGNSAANSSISRRFTKVGSGNIASSAAGNKNNMRKWS